MTDRAIVTALNELADTLNEAAAQLDAIGRMQPGSPLARMVEQGEQFARTIPRPGKPTTWKPEWPT